MAYWADSVIESRCPDFCVCHHKTLSSRGRGDLWSKNVFLILGCDDTIFKKKVRTLTKNIIWIDPHPSMHVSPKHPLPKVVETSGWRCDDTIFKKKNVTVLFKNNLDQPPPLYAPKTPTSGGPGDLWSNCVLLIFPCNDTILKKFPSRILAEIFLGEKSGNLSTKKSKKRGGKKNIYSFF